MLNVELVTDSLPEFEIPPPLALLALPPPPVAELLLNVEVATDSVPEFEIRPRCRFQIRSRRWPSCR